MAGSEGTSPRLLVDTLTLALYNLLILVGIFVPFCGKSTSYRVCSEWPSLDQQITSGLVSFGHNDGPLRVKPSLLTLHDGPQRTRGGYVNALCS